MTSTLRPIGGVLFDLDGTLVNSLPDITDAVNAALQADGLDAACESDVRAAAGHGATRLLHSLLSAAQGGVSPTAAQLQRARLAKLRFETERSKHAATRVRAVAFDGVSLMLQQLSAAQLPLAVLSNGDERVVRATVAHALSRARFVTVAGARDDAPLKPAAEAACRVLDAHQVFGALPRAAVAMVGDTDVDMRTAVAAGLTPVAVTWGFRDEATLRAAGARHVVHTPAQLAHLLLRSTTVDSVNQSKRVPM
eukprot:gb/GEZJ01000989.1/.p2 GENE.gb/GEZJ01000989.1/~~gb/GEZJ01000989.1/.p2  ORF type:complete len:252 (-),score=52.65 gb/GEZJ01000989.1/:1090-1845(-)